VRKPVAVTVSVIRLVVGLLCTYNCTCEWSTCTCACTGTLGTCTCTCCLSKYWIQVCLWWFSSTTKCTSTARVYALSHFNASAQRTSVKPTDWTQYSGLLVTSGY